MSASIRRGSLVSQSKHGGLSRILADFEEKNPKHRGLSRSEGVLSGLLTIMEVPARNPLWRPFFDRKRVCRSEGSRLSRANRWPSQKPGKASSNRDKPPCFGYYSAESTIFRDKPPCFDCESMLLRMRYRWGSLGEDVTTLKSISSGMNAGGWLCLRLCRRTLA